MAALRIIDPKVNNCVTAHMGAEPQNFSVDATASLLGWWRDAGVDTVITETPHDWLGLSVPAKVAPVVSKQTPPKSLEALTEMLMTADLPDAGPPHRRVAPSGDCAAKLMILVDFPDSADVDTGLLLSDPVFEKMLAAVGETRASVYLASLCPGRPLTGRLPRENVDSFADYARQHIALIGPEKLWLVGTAASRALLGIDDAAAKGKLHTVNHSSGITLAIATAHPRMFDGSKSRKAAAWAEMQRLIAGTPA